MNSHTCKPGKIHQSYHSGLEVQFALVFPWVARAEYTTSPKRVSTRTEACQYPERGYNYPKHFTVRLIIKEIFCDLYRMSKITGGIDATMNLTPDGKSLAISM